MNFLAHLYLSGDDRDMILGNLIADSVRGSSFIGYKPSVQKGIILHRKIDDFTDSHPVVFKSKERLRPRYNHYGSVIVDMYYDHFLAAGWHNYSGEDLYDLTVKAYEILINNMDVLPVKVRKMLPYMLASNWLYSYRDLDMLTRYFRGMSRRARFESGMEHAVEDLKLHYHLYKEEFEAFFPDLINEAGKTLAELTGKREILDYKTS
jgi:acyl carrier protein phosphodiesterase